MKVYTINYVPLIIHCLEVKGHEMVKEKKKEKT